MLCLFEMWFHMFVVLPAASDRQTFHTNPVFVFGNATCTAVF